MTMQPILYRLVSCSMTCNRHLLFLRLDNTAVIPMRATVNSVGFDLSSKNNRVSQIVPAHGQAVVKTGLRILIPQGYYGKIAERSDMSWKNPVSIGAGVIDPGYEGEVGVVLRNHGDTDLEILPGQKIAQLIVDTCVIPPAYEVKMYPVTGGSTFERMGDGTSVRGEGVFGSTAEKRRLVMDEQQQQQQQQQEPPNKKKFPTPPPPEELPKKIKSPPPSPSPPPTS